MVLGIGIVTIALDGFVLCAVANFLAFVPALVGPSCTLALVPSTDATTVTVLAGLNPLLFGVTVGATATLGPVGAPGSPLSVDGFTQILGYVFPLCLFFAFPLFLVRMESCSWW